jgi:hypothetical protein
MDKALSLRSLDHDVFDVRHHSPFDQITETFDHTSLVHGPRVLQTERHCYIVV